MLSVDKIEPDVDVSIKFDRYVPLSITTSSAKPIRPYYWRAGDGRKSLLEMGVHSTTGLLLSITLTSFNPQKVEYVPALDIEGFVSCNGIPVVNICDWKADSYLYRESFIDEFNQNFRLIIGSACVQIVFDDVESTAETLRCGRLRLGVSKNRLLSSIAVQDVTTAELDMLSSSC